MKKLGVVVLLAACATACARVHVQKVPTPSQYLKWTDEMQAKADALHGVRFYLPRPFVNVFESFPIRTDIYYAVGRVGPDGRYVVLDKIYKPDGTVAADFGTIAIAKRSIFRPGGVEDLFTAQSDDEPEPEEPEPPEGAAEPKKPAEPLPATAVTELGVINDPNAFSYQPMRGNFDLVYVPDFEEQYALRVKGGVGRAKAKIALGQGWSLQGLEATADNSALADRLFKLIDTAQELAQDFAKAASPLAALPGTTELFTPQSDTEDDKGRPGTPVTLKITVLHYAAKGLYPILKPREVQPRQLDCAAKPAESYVLTADLGGAQRAKDHQTIVEGIGSVIVPMYPYQYVSFNTFRYVAVEALHPDTPFAGLYDRTGTAGDPGDRQYADLRDLFGGPPPGGGMTQERLAKMGNEVKSEIEGNTDLADFKVEKVALVLSGTTVDATIHLTARGADRAGFESFVRMAISSLLQQSDPSLTLGKLELKGGGNG